MKTRGTGIVGYNVQTVVDAKHHLIVAQETTGTQTLTVIADRGYFNGTVILACHEAGITPMVPKTVTSGAKAD